MTDCDIRAMLRGATAAKVIWGWQQNLRGFVVSSLQATTPEMSREQVIDFCSMLIDAGVRPLYLDSEPLHT